MVVLEKQCLKMADILIYWIKDGSPIQPYDVTSHSLSLLMGVSVKPVYKSFKYNVPTRSGSGSGIGNGTSGCSNPRKFRLYRSNIPSMDEGWTRWVFENYRVTYASCSKFDNIGEKEARTGAISSSTNAIVFPDQGANQILNGYREGSMPKEYTGGLGKQGVENLKKYVENGGTLVFLNRSSDFAIEQFNLPIKNITKGLTRKDFFIPGSILRTELDTSHPIAKGMPQKSIAWFGRSPVFEVMDSSRVKVIAKYPANPKEILLSGWALGKEKIAGKAALVEVKMGKGKIILFGFRPQYRAQSLATFPLLFNAISK